MALRIEFVGHACVRIEIDGLRVLTDPVLCPRLGHVRRIAPPPDASSLADVDVVLVSHAHHDHLDVGSLRSLPGSPRVLCAAPAVGPVRRAGLAALPLAPGESVDEGSVRIEATPADHEGRRWPFIGGSESLGFALRGPSGGVYFAGDTDLFDEMAEIGGIDVALVPVAGWGPNLGPGHIGPDEAARAAAMVDPRVAIPIHWGTYRRMLMRRNESDDAPARRFVDELGRVAPGVRGLVLEPGEGIDIELDLPSPE